MSDLNKAAAAVAGLSFVGLLTVLLVWALIGGVVKAYLPNELGYSDLGWVRRGWRNVWIIGVPKWAGPEGFQSALQAPLRHHRVWLKQGQKIVAVYDLRIERGRMSIACFRTRLSVLSTIVHGVLVEDYKFLYFRPGRHTGVFECAAPVDGIYELDIDIDWDKDANRRRAVPLPDYDLVYDVRWRLER